MEPRDRRQEAAGAGGAPQGRHPEEGLHTKENGYANEARNRSVPAIEAPRSVVTIAARVELPVSPPIEIAASPRGEAP